MGYYLPNNPSHCMTFQSNSLHILSVTFQTIPRHTMPLHYKSRYLFIIHSVRNTSLFLFSLYTQHGVQKKRHSLWSALYLERNIIIITAVIGIATIFIGITVVVIVVCYILFICTEMFFHQFIFSFVLWFGSFLFCFSL